MIVACCLILLKLSPSFLQINADLQKCVSPSDLVQPGLVVPASEENKADGAEEVGVGDLDHQHEDVHVDELGGTKIGNICIGHLANKTSHIAHVGEVRSDDFFVDILAITSRGVSDGGADADEERHSLGVEAVLQKPGATTTCEMYFKNVVYHQVDKGNVPKRNFNSKTF